MNPFFNISETDLFLEIFAHSCGSPQLRQPRPWSVVSTLTTLRLGGRRACGSSFGKLIWKAAVVTLVESCGTVRQSKKTNHWSRCGWLSLICSGAHVTKHIFHFFFGQTILCNVTVHFYLTLTAVVWVSSKPHHICAATHLPQIEKMYTVLVKISLGISANMWWGPPGRRKADSSL